ncbi:acVLRF1 family peptidyl-tRNA hydrolase [Nonomuraea sp. NBC_01738]|uniref:acVLRF1 family peptidyl-tRNA hydrolase n=1 Tax=Nonomuraea sp. NBC_01738 TaxID=2976003 RepID=UPI002E107244|nr:acVLRF1 family peptidyl-tRNA hydrolase [Nonomuraea sp. NBC_01738]
MGAQPAKGGGRWVQVAPERIHRWIDGFADRHGAFETKGCDDVVVLRAADGAVAEFAVPFPPMEPGAPYVAKLVAHASRRRRVGVVLVRMGGYAAGVFDGDELIASKVGSRLVQGRTAAGGWSQQRFARRRKLQADQAFDAAGQTASRVLSPYLDTLEAVVFGGDRRAVDALREEQRLAPLFNLEAEPFLTVPDPRLAVLKEAQKQFRAVRVRVVDPV